MSRHGLWVLVDDRELFLAFDRFPWFQHATIGALMHVERPHAEHLRWPELDVDLTVESIEHPERFPLVSKVNVPKTRARQRATDGTRRRPGTRRS